MMDVGGWPGFADLRNASRRALPLCLVLASAVTVNDGRLSPAGETVIEPVGAFGSQRGSDCGTTILIATGRDTSYTLTALSDGVRFDFDADGNAERTSWTPPMSEVAFLAIDRDKDGAITSGRELVGQYGWPGVKSGFTALADMRRRTEGATKRGTLRSQDSLFGELLLWTDRNHDGRSHPSELRALADVVSDLGLAYSAHHRSDGHGNEFVYRGFAFVRAAADRNRGEARFEGMLQLRHTYDVCLVRQ